MNGEDLQTKKSLSPTQRCNFRSHVSFVCSPHVRADLGKRSIVSEFMVIMPWDTFIEKGVLLMGVVRYTLDVDMAKAVDGFLKVVEAQKQAACEIW